ncbi:MAG: hypothetical protein K2X68_09495, partial [Novosphingobium sp.]|nr:hypothetical protein [Novosphingobium sp.]
MPDETAPQTESPESLPGAPRAAKRRKVALICAGALAALAIGLWAAREQIAQRLIDRQLAQLGLPGRYAIESIGADRQILNTIVIGDPAHPDLTIARAEVRLAYGLTGPRIGRIILEKPRLYGTYRQGRLSFGALDPVLFPKQAPGSAAGLPDLDLRLIDGRALLESDFGRLAVKTEGAGNLSGGFKGTLAAIMPGVTMGGCSGERLSAYGTVAVSSGRPRFAGPVRLAGLACGKALTAGPAALALDVTGDKDFGGAAIKGKLDAGAIAAPGLAAAHLTLGGELALTQGELRGHVLSAAQGVRTAG